MFDGSLVALITPFRDGNVDVEKVSELTRWHVERGSSGIVPCGTTGEAPSLDGGERSAVIRAVVSEAGGRIPVIVGTGTNSTRVTIEHTKEAKDLGADGALVVTPYYNKPPQEGLFRHFEAVAEAVDLPIVLYNVPSRTGVTLAPETVARLAEHKNIVAIKDATGDLDQVTRQRELCDIAVLSGDDAMTYPILCLGGRGVISVAANIIPSDVADLCSAGLEGDLKRARQIHGRFYNLFRGLFLETNPIPVKAAAAMMGMIDSGEPRLPLCPISPAGRARLQDLLKSYGLA